MSDENVEDEALKAFAEALASLRPRSDRLDRRWRSLLAKEAALTESLRNEGEGAPVDSLPACSEPESVSPTLPNCDNPAGHLFVCACCGTVVSAGIAATTNNRASTVRGKRRWAWPAAFAAMTAVAAVLLVTLLVYPAPQQVVDRGGSPAPATDVAAGGQSDETGNPLERDFSRWATVRVGGNGQRILTAGDVRLPDCLLARYFVAPSDSSAMRKPTSVHEIETTEASLTNFDLLHRL